MYKKFIIDKVVNESSIVKSFYLKQEDGRVLADYKPGQFITVKVQPENSEKELIRNYTLSDIPNKNYYRITIKREEHGQVSRFFHDNLKTGDTIMAKDPTGSFFLSMETKKPVVMLSGGVGITPMISMLEYILENEPERKVHFIHSSRNRDVQPMMKRLRKLTSENENLNLFINHSEPNDNEHKGIDYDFDGFITEEFLFKTLPKIEADYYLCGPVGFMETMYTYLIGLNVPKENIYYEFFGEGKQLGEESPKFIDSNSSHFKVKFTESNKESNWDAKQSSILDFAESMGLKLESSCRMGTCSSCESTLIKGNVEYNPEPFINVPKNKILICCAIPTSDIEIAI